MTTEPVPGDDASLLARPGLCWRTAQATRAATLIDGQAWFDALASSLSKAKRSVVVLGWQFDPRTRLDAESRHGDRHAEIGHLLRMMVKSRPDLDVRLLIWNSPILIAASQGFFPHRAQRWFRKRFVEFRLDRPGPIGACHHQKMVVIDDAVAFCGSGDLGPDRWDTLGHLDADPRRVQPNGRLAPARHETMCVVEGPAARALGDLARERWFRATWERTVPDPEGVSDPWPDGVEAEFADVPVGISRTEPKWGGRGAAREVEALHLDAIRSARRRIYFENQYFTSPAIAAALAERLKEPDGPEVVVVSTGSSPSWFDGITMDTARSEVLYRLEQADAHDRFFAFSPNTRRGESIIVHAKVTVIDDTLLRIGSANLNNRSMGFDTECDLSLEPDTAEGRAAVEAFRHRSIGHFLGVDAAAFAATEALFGSMGKAIEKLNAGRMSPLGATPPSAIERVIAEWQLGDPRATDDAWRPWKRRNASQRPYEERRRTLSRR
ncbi:MAG TPA: phospholipase D-like domain-containing protein [Brevundimonas sp.]|jgi:phosphatidylserine/phosphatidylglycerophosphate/cardiolipin synthase-like enzyme|uniref:phospholipase D-like domain-containing protein n=1 Tax=Brevundimonas sp. TaxID=1871086 RepID=UPI002DE434E9|nr:phospholipase D-like domain-containing protein [Brevundimonas sp.]